MFDPRIINGKNQRFAYYIIRHKQDPREDNKWLNLARWIDNTFSLNFVLENVQLIDYMFAHRYSFVIANGVTRIRCDRRHIAKGTIDGETAVQEFIKTGIGGTNPFGKYFTTCISELDIEPIHLALFVPSQPYDVCTMGWDDYYQLYTFACHAQIDDEFLTVCQKPGLAACERYNERRVYTPNEQTVQPGNTRMQYCTDLSPDGYQRNPHLTILNKHMESQIAFGPEDFVGPTYLDEVFDVILG